MPSVQGRILEMTVGSFCRTLELVLDGGVKQCFIKWWGIGWVCRKQ